MGPRQGPSSQQWWIYGLFGRLYDFACNVRDNDSVIEPSQLRLAFIGIEIRDMKEMKLIV